MVYNLIFDEIAKHYTNNKSYAKRIKTLPGFFVLPFKAEVLPAIFTNFPNILNNQPLKEEDIPRPPSPWSF
jgi:hypothetical protein